MAQPVVPRGTIVVQQWCQVAPRGATGGTTLHHRTMAQNGKKAAKTSKKSKCFNFDKNFTGLFPTTYLIMKQKEFFFIKLFLQTEK